jgi:hypothetical protein
MVKPRSLEDAVNRFREVGALFSVARRREFSDLASQDLSRLVSRIHPVDVIKGFRDRGSENPAYESYSEHSFGDREDAFNPVFHSLIETVRPHIVVEVGTWFGTSSVIMASHMRRMGLEGKIFCVDDFNGWPACWTEPDFPKNAFGRSLVYEAFLGRVVSRQLEDYIVPMPTTSSHAYGYFSEMGMQADLIYIDAAHDERSVSNDLLGYYACMREGGMLFGDDYTLQRYGYYPVKAAVDRFAEEWDLTVQTHDEKWVIEARMPFLTNTPEHDAAAEALRRT